MEQRKLNYRHSYFSTCYFVFSGLHPHDPRVMPGDLAKKFGHWEIVKLFRKVFTGIPVYHQRHAIFPGADIHQKKNSRLKFRWRNILKYNENIEQSCLKLRVRKY